MGDLDPQSIFIEAAQKRSEPSSLHRNHSDVGTWMRQPTAQRPTTAAAAASRDHHHHQQHAESGMSSGHAAAAAASPSPFSQAAFSRSDGVPTMPGLRLRATGTVYPEMTRLGEQLVVMPPEHDYRCLHAIYSEQVHPMLPFLEPADLAAIKNPPKSSPRISIFRQAVALAAAVVDPAATAPHLRLDPNGDPLPLAAFHHRLATALFRSLDAHLLPDQIDRIRLLLLLSLFYQPAAAAHPLERDTNPLLFSQAVHFAQSLGIHLSGYRPDVDTRAGAATANGDDGAVERLFCLCWALDRLHAAFHGRPCLLHERDTDRDLDACIAAQPDPAFRLFMAVAQMLDSVIWLYRPRKNSTSHEKQVGAKGGPAVDLPIFESMIVRMGGEKLPPRILTTLEVFYHAVSVLSCRQPLSDFQPTAPPLAHLPQPHLNARRSLSADRIIEIVESCLPLSSSTTTAAAVAAAADSSSLCTLPFVPYAVALALSVAYRKMRYSKIPMYRLRGKNRFKDVVALLQRLGEVYTSARVNASLGISILRELDKTVKEFASSGGGGSVSVGGSMLTPGETTHSVPVGSMARTAASVDGDVMMTTSPRRQQQQQQQQLMRQSEGEFGVVVGDARQESRPTTAVGTLGVTQGGGVAGYLAGQGSHAEAHLQQPNSSSGQTMVDDAYTSQQPNRLGPVFHPAAVEPATTASPSWAQMEDIDLFGHFDPAYDLNAVEAALEANLDMGCPQNWTIPWLG